MSSTSLSDPAGAEAAAPRLRVQQMGGGGWGE